MRQKLIWHCLQYAILMASVLNSLARYGLSSIELRRASRRGGANAPPWENKSMYIFYIELATGTSTYGTLFASLILSPPHRLLEVGDVPDVLCGGPDVLWIASQHHP